MKVVSELNPEILAQVASIVVFKAGIWRRRKSRAASQSAFRKQNSSQLLYIFLACVKKPQLPSDVQVIVSISDTTDPTKLSQMAEQILQICEPSGISAVSSSQCVWIRRVLVLQSMLVAIWSGARLIWIMSNRLIADHFLKTSQLTLTWTYPSFPGKIRITSAS